MNENTIRSFQVSKQFIDKLKKIQNDTKENGIIKTQEQIFDEMMELYELHLKETSTVFIREELEDEITNISEAYYQSMLKILENFVRSIEKRNDTLAEKVNELISQYSKK